MKMRQNIGGLRVLSVGLLAAFMLVGCGDNSDPIRAPIEELVRLGPDEFEAEIEGAEYSAFVIGEARHGMIDFPEEERTLHVFEFVPVLHDDISMIKFMKLSDAPEIESGLFPLKEVVPVEWDPRDPIAFDDGWIFKILVDMPDGTHGTVVSEGGLFHVGVAPNGALRGRFHGFGRGNLTRGTQPLPRTDWELFGSFHAVPGGVFLPEQ